MNDVQRYQERMLRSLRQHAADAGHCQEFRDQCTEAVNKLDRELGELCPGCDQAEGTRWTGSTTSTDSWTCQCGHEWIITVEVPVGAAR